MCETREIEEQEKIIAIKDMFIKCNENGDIQLRILPVNVPPYIVDTAFNIKSLLKGKVEVTAKKFKDTGTQEIFKTFINQFINKEYKRVTSYLDVYVLKNCDIQKPIEVRGVPKLEIENLANVCIESLFNSMYDEELETYILTVFSGEFIYITQKYYIPTVTEIGVKDTITKNTKRVTYYNCEDCIQEHHLKGLVGNVMIRYFCDDCNCEIKENKAIQYGDKKLYYHHNCLMARLRKKSDLTRQDIEQIINDNEISLKKYYYCSKCSKAIKECVIKYDKKMYDVICFRELIEKEKGYKLTDEEFDELVNDYLM